MTRIGSVSCLATFGRLRWCVLGVLVWSMTHSIICCLCRRWSGAAYLCSLKGCQTRSSKRSRRYNQSFALDHVEWFLLMRLTTVVRNAAIIDDSMSGLDKPLGGDHAVVRIRLKHTLYDRTRWGIGWRSPQELDGIVISHCGSKVNNKATVWIRCTDVWSHLALDLRWRGMLSETLSDKQKLQPVIKVFCFPVTVVCSRYILLL